MREINCGIIVFRNEVRYGCCRVFNNAMMCAAKVSPLIFRVLMIETKESVLVKTSS